MGSIVRSSDLRAAGGIERSTYTRVGFIQFRCILHSDYSFNKLMRCRFVSHKRSRQDSCFSANKLKAFWTHNNQVYIFIINPTGSSGTHFYLLNIVCFRSDLCTQKVMVCITIRIWFYLNNDIFKMHLFILLTISINRFAVKNAFNWNMARCERSNIQSVRMCETNWIY